MNPKRLLSFLTGAIFLVLTVSAAHGLEWPRVAYSKDGTPISYEVYGSGEPALVFVHGWSCDARYWRAQVPHFSKAHRVILVDLAGHGHSGTGRTRYTMAAFGEDVRAVIESEEGRRVILIGHSMGGSIIAEAARLIPERVVGLIGVDTLENVEMRMTHREYKKMLAPFKKNFREGTRQFVSGIISPDTDARVREWILSDMSAASPRVAMSALHEYLNRYVTGEEARAFDRVRVPVVCVNGDLWPINYEANRRHMLSFDAIVLKKADHFLMVDRPEEFNRALEQAIRMLSNKRPGSD